MTFVLSTHDNAELARFEADSWEEAERHNPDGLKLEMVVCSWEMGGGEA